MKKLFVIIGILCLYSFSYAQNDSIEIQSNTESEVNPHEIKTLFGKNRGVGVYAGFSFGYSPIGKHDALVAGGSLGLILGQHLTIGIAGKGFATDIDDFGPKDGTKNYYYNGGYGGILLEPIVFPKWPVHVSFPIILGAGGVGYYWEEYDVAQEYWKDGYSYSNFFLVAEPGAEIELNLTRFMRMSLGASYRYTTASNIDGISSNGINGWSSHIAFKFGIF